MTRNAKLYLLEDKEWQLVTKEANDPLYITVYQLFSVDSISRSYAIISLCEKVDGIIESFGGTQASEKDSLRTTLHDYYGDPLFGNKENIIYLEKLA